MDNTKQNTNPTGATKAAEKILCVDDEPRVLDSYRRALGQRYNMTLVSDSKEALEILQTQDDFAVVISDMLMPGMDGAELLSRATEIAPDCVRVMLTGHSSLDTAISAINQGRIFRFLMKPCSASDLARSIDACIEQYRLIRTKRELLTKTLTGTIKLLGSVVSHIQPQLTDIGARIQPIVHGLCESLDVQPEWEIEIAGHLANIGLVLQPKEITEKVTSGAKLTATERELYENHVVDAYNLLSNIPYLENVAKSVLYHHKSFNGEGYPKDDVKGYDLPIGSRILHVAIHWDEQIDQGLSKELAIGYLLNHQDRYDPIVLEALCNIHQLDNTRVIKRILLNELREGMILADQVVTSDGIVLSKKGVQVTKPVLVRLKNYHINMGIKQPIRVFMPVEDESLADFETEHFEPVKGDHVIQDQKH